MDQSAGRGRRWLGIVVLACLAAAQTAATVNDVISLVRTAIQNRQSDSHIAKALRRIKLRERLDDRTIEALEGDGAGPEALRELRQLRQMSSALPKPSPSLLFQERPGPSSDEQRRAVEQARERALSYTSSLPDFICTQEVRRYDDSRRKLMDTLTLQLRYAGHQENYQLLTINGRKTVLRYDAVGGVITQGEFGSLLDEVFGRQSAAEFRWDHWAALHQRAALVYSFRVPAQRSRYRIEAVGRSRRMIATVGQHGLVYLDRDTSQTVRIVTEVDDIPADFPVEGSWSTLDYGFVDIGGRQFLLPLHAEVRMKTEDADTRNDVEFHSYRKFAADSSISFDPR